MSQTSEVPNLTEAAQKMEEFVNAFKKVPAFTYIDEDDAYKTYWESVVAYPDIP